MSDISTEFAALPDDIKSIVTKPEVLEVITSLIDKSKQPLVAKRDELLATISEHNEFVKQLGGRDAIKSLAQQAAEATAKAAEAAAISTDVETVKKTYSDQLAAKSKELDDLKSTITQEKVSNTLNRAIREAKGVPELIEPHLRQRIRSEVVDGQVKITVLGANGAPLLLDNGKEASINDLLAEFKLSPIFARAFEATRVSGSGASQSVDVGDVINPWNPVTHNITEQSRIFKANPEKARAMALMFGKVI